MSKETFKFNPNHKNNEYRKQLRLIVLLVRGEGSEYIALKTILTKIEPCNLQVS